MGFGSDPVSGKSIPDPGVKKSPDPGSESAMLEFFKELKTLSLNRLHVSVVCSLLVLKKILGSKL